MNQTRPVTVGEVERIENNITAPETGAYSSRPDGVFFSTSIVLSISAIILLFTIGVLKTFSIFKKK